MAGGCGGRVMNIRAVRVVILVRDTSIFVPDTSSRCVLHNCEVSLYDTKGVSSLEADTKLHLKQSRGNNSESMKVRVAILVPDIVSRCVLHNCKVS